MKVKVNFKKPTVLLSAEKYSSMLAEIDDLRGALEIAKKNSTLREMGWQMLHDQIDELKRKNRGLQAENMEAHALIAELNDQIEASESALAESESKRDHNATLYETASRAATELADMLVRANAEADKARAEAEDIKLELMDREFRINELEKQVEWLRENESNYQNLLAENTELISKNMDLKRAFNETYEKEADFCAEAQFERERADQLEEANKNLYAQVLAQRDTIERLQCQRAADEEDYNTLKGMYDELHMAAQDLVTHIRK